MEQKELVEHRVRAYLDCSYHNKTIANEKIKYLEYMSKIIVAQMGLIFGIFIAPILQKNIF